MSTPSSTSASSNAGWREPVSKRSIVSPGSERHAMRRPRGPGGRFLTAEEIAAQKAGEHLSPVAIPIEDGDEDMDEDDTPIDLQPSPSAVIAQPQPPQLQQLAVVSTPEQPPPPPPQQSEFIQSPNPMTMLNMAYSPLTLSHPPMHLTSQPQAQTQAPKSMPQAAPTHTMYSQQSHHHSGGKGTTNTAPITLSPPYAAVQMHHVPHPHAHARHHHSNLNYTQGLYADVPDAELQRRTEEMLQYGGAASAT
ncbi:hypothetical protein BDN72DRAFT_853370 [Pluteus cervinus]|uniref:Uncharacterized protein n=1 Tax=Pluteus cervinus TaxID=181527 RepID=A0ACD3BBR5_9AGAR|nr:hypothetical protein BDN72DRAFT_853370 [Pluteus cervinus]